MFFELPKEIIILILSYLVEKQYGDDQIYKFPELISLQKFRCVNRKATDITDKVTIFVRYQPWLDEVYCIQVDVKGKKNGIKMGFNIIEHTISPGNIGTYYKPSEYWFCTGKKFETSVGWVSRLNTFVIGNYRSEIIEWNSKENVDDIVSWCYEVIPKHIKQVMLQVVKKNKPVLISILPNYCKKLDFDC